MGYQGNYGTSLFADYKLQYDASTDKICRKESVTTNLATAVGQLVGKCAYVRPMRALHAHMPAHTHTHA